MTIQRWCLSALLAGAIGCSRVTTPSMPPSNSGSAVLADLESLPVGIKVIHTPAQVRSPVGPNPQGWPFRWLFRTEVHAIDRPLTIIQFGICAWDGNQWILPTDNRRYNSGVLNRQTFKEWYDCPTARIEPGKPAIDPQNWAGNRTRASFRQRWFFIGVDNRGNRYKGEGVVELLDSD
jgi:hypothetical protein